MPLPKPKAGETLEQFLEYCPFDPEIRAEFQDFDQRLAVCSSLYEQATKENKSFAITTPKIKKAEYIKAWDRQVRIAENREFKKWNDYFKRENFKGVDQFLATGKTTGFDGLFLDRDITELYENLFTSVGTQVALWYQNNFEKFIVKQQTVQGWRDIFGAFGRQFAADKVTLVSGNRKKELQGILKKLMSDPEFQSLNEREAQRILRSQFSRYSKVQAMRLVRTETVTAANYASTQTANDLFGDQGYTKEWLTAIDGRERPAHRAANGQQVMADEPFVVGGEFLKFPADPSASAKNRINCRCTILTYPLGAIEEIENQQTGGLVTDLGFNIDGSERTSVGAEIAQIIGQNFATREVIEEATETLRDIKIKEYIAKNKPDDWNTEITEWAFKKATAKNLSELNDDILEFIKKDDLTSIKVGIERNSKGQTKGSYQSTRNKKIHFDAEELWSERYITVYHEIGHHIHDSVNLFMPWKEGLMQKEWGDFFTKWRKKFGYGARGKNKEAIEAELNKLFPNPYSFDGYYKRDEIWNKENGKWKTIFKDEIEELGEEVVYEQAMSVADTVEAFTRAKFGWGHGSSYYTSEYMSEAEIFAHMSEWKFGNATIIKKLYPEFYDEAMKLYDELIEAIRKQRGY